jgi:hypothetical protein
VPRVNFSRAAAREAACFQNKAEINAAVERYNLQNGSPPNNINAIDQPTYFPDGLPRCPVTGGKYVLHGLTGRVNGHVAGSH